MAQQQRRYSEEQWKELKFKLTLLVVILIVGGAVAGAGPGLEPIFLKRAIERKTEPWAPKWMLNIARLEEWTFRRKRAKELYENEFYWAYRGNESINEGLAALVEELYSEQDDPDRWKYFLPWKVAPYLDAADEAGKKQPEWIGGEFAKPHKLMGPMLLRLARMYEDDRDYISMRHIHKAVKYCFKDDAEVVTQVDEAIRRDSVRQY